MHCGETNKSVSMDRLKPIIIPRKASGSSPLQSDWNYQIILISLFNIQLQLPKKTIKTCKITLICSVGTTSTDNYIYFVYMDIGHMSLLQTEFQTKGNKYSSKLNYPKSRF